MRDYPPPINSSEFHVDVALVVTSPFSPRVPLLEGERLTKET